MNTDLYNKVEQFVVEALTKAGNENDIVHHRRTVHWIRNLKPDADEALLIAGMSHDIERAFHGDWKAGSTDPEALRKHQENSATIVAEFLQKEGAGEELINRVKELILHHEEGGDEDQNVLCDADALSFFEDKAPRYVRKALEQGKSKEYIKSRRNHVFGRITSEKAKKIALELSKKAYAELE